jgi:hypothetical protein
MIVSAGSPHRAGVTGMPHADLDATTFAKTLSTIPADRVVTCVGPDATAAVVDVRFRLLLKKAKSGDELILFLSGTTIDNAGRTILPCWDTLPDSSAETGIDIADWFKRIEQSKFTNVVGLFDVAHDTDFPESTRIVGFVSTGSGESSFASGTPSRGIWTGLMIDAFSGRLPAALNDSGALTTT